MTYPTLRKYSRLWPLSPEIRSYPQLIAAGVLLCDAVFFMIQSERLLHWATGS